MKVTETGLPDLLLIEPELFKDERGFFFESFNQQRFERAIGYSVTFVQDNHTQSNYNVLRGLHYQIEQTQGKLIRIIAGEVFDVSVDLRKSSPTFGKWFGIHLSADNKKMLWIPKGFAHGFLVLSSQAETLYKTTDYWMPEHERCIAWNDPKLSIAWPISDFPLLSAKDAAGEYFEKIETFA